MKSNEEFDKELQKVLNDEIPAKPKGGRRRRKRWKKPLLFAGIGVLGFLFLMSRVFGSSSAVSVPVEAQPLTKGEVVESLTLNGPVSGTDSVDVVSNLHLEVTEISVKEGDYVEKGQCLALLDASSLEREIAQARSRYELAVAAEQENQKNRQAAYEKALQTLEENQRAWERAEVLHQAGDISDVEWETARAAKVAAEKDVVSYEVRDGRVQSSAADRQQIEAARFELENKQKDLENTQIISPIAGTVTRVNSKVGRFADKTEDEKPMFIIENLDQLQLSIRVSEYSIGKVKVGQKAVISADILNGKTLNGEVSMISPSGEEKGDGSTERVIPITVSIDSKDSDLIAGITAKAKLTLAESKDTFVVPSSALIQASDGSLSIATVQNGSSLHLIPVTTGVESDFESEIFAAGEEALSTQLQYLPNPPMNAMEGMPVLLASVQAESESAQTESTPTGNSEIESVEAEDESTESVAQ
ncbi:MAG: efflux RND transporter periplasmic adaptor subunit [bacterium]|nr:efflux RND transporter periplasmic adaptor subunit [bacterium]